MSRKQFWTLVILAAPTPLIVGLIIGAVVGLHYDSDRAELYREVLRKLEERQ